MSKTFTSGRSSVNSRGRGASTRGTDRSLPGQSTSTPQANPGSSGRGRDPVSGPVTRTRSRSKPTDTKKNTERTTMYPQGSRRDMPNRPYNVRQHHPDMSTEQPRMGQQHHPPEETSQEESSQGQYAGGYTVFQPNPRKKQQITEMAQRGTAAYEKYKERKPTNLNYVGTVGGDVEEEAARKRQSHDNRFQKLKRQQRQEEMRTAKREAEQREIDSMRRDARRKADENELRGKTVDPEDLRRRREAFLRRVENQGQE